MIDVTTHYWIVGGSTTEVYSSATNTMVPVTDQGYVDWAAVAGFMASPIASEAELADALIANGSPLPSWLLATKAPIQPTPTTYSKDQLAAYNADKRWREETGGMTVTITAGPMPIKTDDRSQAKITGQRLAAQADAAFTTDWSGADGMVYPLTASEIISMSDQQQTHVTECFAISATVRAGIAADTITTLAEIDAAYA